jgi:hypothetical protein
MDDLTARARAPEALRAAWDALRSREPHLHNPAAARRLGVSEAELVASRAGAGAWPLLPDAGRLLGEVVGMGRLLFACHGAAGVALALVEGVKVDSVDDALELTGEGFGLVLSPGGCASAWYFEDHDHHGHTRSLQLFDAQGSALLKVLVLRKRHREALQALAVALAGPVTLPQPAPLQASRPAGALAPAGSGLSATARAALLAATRVQVTVARPGCRLRRHGLRGELSEDAHGFHLSSSGLKLHARPGMLACQEVLEGQGPVLRWGPTPLTALEIALEPAGVSEHGDTPGDRT